nr:acyclic terpene utilization AtuA family protein [Pectobacterium colocasium]
MKTIRIGSGAGYAGDRIEPAVELAQKGDIQYLVFECLAERTIAIGQKQKQQNPEKGYNELLSDRMHAVLPLCLEKVSRSSPTWARLTPWQPVSAYWKSPKRLAQTS